MRNPNKPGLEDQIDRYARGELTGVEARKLAQRSLDEPEMFEELTFSALAKASLSDSAVVKQLERPRSRRTPWIWAGAAAAAAVLVLLYSLPAHNRTTTPAVAAVKPVLGPSATPDRPILLASDLLSAPREPAQVFRGAEPDSRPPQSEGSILSTNDGLAAMNLGSLDGVAKGSELEVFRGEKSIGRLVVSTVFRERSRAGIPAGLRIQMNDQVRVPAAVYVEAALEKINALSEQGQTDAARTMAEKTIGSAAPADRWKVLERLAALEFQAGLLQNAEEHFRLAVESSPEQTVALNSLAVLHLLRGDDEGAAGPLSDVVSKSTKTDPVYFRSMNNLGVLAELRGDRKKAAELYTNALGAFTVEDRRVVETNLARLRSSH
jgi:hypothetical protein